MKGTLYLTEYRELARTVIPSINIYILFLLQTNIVKISAILQAIEHRTTTYMSNYQVYKTHFHIKSYSIIMPLRTSSHNELISIYTSSDNRYNDPTIL